MQFLDVCCSGCCYVMLFFFVGNAKLCSIVTISGQNYIFPVQDSSRKSGRNTKLGKAFTIPVQMVFFPTQNLTGNGSRSTKGVQDCFNSRMVLFDAEFTMKNTKLCRIWHFTGRGKIITGGDRKRSHFHRKLVSCGCRRKSWQRLT